MGLGASGYLEECSSLLVDKLHTGAAPISSIIGFSDISLHVDTAHKRPAAHHCDCCHLPDWKQLTPPLQERLRAAIQAEQVHEAAALRALYSAGNLSRLQREGLVLVGLTAAPHSLLFSSMVWELRPGRGAAELGYHRFRPGDSVLLSRWTGEVRLRVRGWGRAEEASQLVRRPSDWLSCADVLHTSAQALRSHLLMPQQLPRCWGASP